jgi:ligand-binding sensor domain-containing protein
MNNTFFNNLTLKLNPVKIVSLSVFILSATFFSQSVKSQPASSFQSFGEDIQAKRFYASTIDYDNVVWFLTEAGLVSFDGSKWTLHNKNRKVPSKELKDVVFDSSFFGPELWIASPMGATVVSSPVDARSGATTYYLDNSSILSENVLAVAVGKEELRWLGTDKGISAFKSSEWLKNSYFRKYPEGLFKDFPITSMNTSVTGDSLYVGTMGGGVLRFYRNDVDAVSGASDYAQWGPILMPSDNVYTIYVSPDGTQWIGTDMGVAKHKGHNSLADWFVFTSDDGLADNLVQAINSNSKGKLYFGTKNGLSVLDGEKWTNYMVDQGLVSNNILSIAIDKNDVVWLGTDNGVSCIKNGTIINYR